MQIKRLLITGSEWKKLREWLLETKGYQSSSFIQLRNSDLEPNFFNVNCPVDECLVISIQVSAATQTISYDAPKYGSSKTYGGELVENIVQAISRDILAEALVRLDENFPATFTIHDEVVCIPRKNNFKEFERIMLQVPVWAKGLP